MKDEKETLWAACWNVFVGMKRLQLDFTEESNATSLKDILMLLLVFDVLFIEEVIVGAYELL